MLVDGKAVHQHPKNISFAALGRESDVHFAWLSDFEKTLRFLKRGLPRGAGLW